MQIKILVIRHPLIGFPCGTVWVSTEKRRQANDRQGDTHPYTLDTQNIVVISVLLKRAQTFTFIIRISCVGVRACVRITLSRSSQKVINFCYWHASTAVHQLMPILKHCLWPLYPQTNLPLRPMRWYSGYGARMLTRR